MRARENPFRTSQVLRVRYRPRGESSEDLFERLRRLDYRGAIVGPKGAGKTTLLEDLEPALHALGFELKRLRLDDRVRSFSPGFLNRFFADLTGKDVILFDGAERMDPISWHRFKRRAKKARGLIITSHRPGMLPTLRACETCPELLNEIISELLGTELDTTRNTANALHKKHNGNLRDALREMYDLYASTGNCRPDEAIKRAEIAT